MGRGACLIPEARILDSEKGLHHEMQRRMVGPVAIERFEAGQREIVDLVPGPAGRGDDMGIKKIPVDRL